MIIFDLLKIYDLSPDIFNSDDIKVKIKMFNKVSKEDIIKFANKLNLEGIFFLEGDL